jgi:transposase-like protein
LAKRKKPAVKKPLRAKKPVGAAEARTGVRSKIGRGDRRRYTDDERAAALAAVVANGGCVEVTARSLGIPTSTLQCWQKGHRCPEALQLRNEKAGELATAMEEIAWLLLAIIPEKVYDAPLNHLMAAFGIMVDKMLRLRGAHTTYGRTDTTNTSAPLDWTRLSPEELATFVALYEKLRGTGHDGPVFTSPATHCR